MLVLVGILALGAQIFWLNPALEVCSTIFYFMFIVIFIVLNQQVRYQTKNQILILRVILITVIASL
jgi:hypothetical protein